MTTANKLVGRIKRTKLDGRGRGFEKALSDTALGVLLGEISVSDSKRVFKAADAQLKKYDPRKVRA